MPNVQWQSLPDPPREDFLSWLRDAAQLAVRDASAHGTTAANYAQRMYRERIQPLTSSSTAEQVTAACTAYQQAVDALTSRGWLHATPPLAAAVPFADVDAHPPTVDPSTFGEIAQRAARALPADDALRGAINRWSDWWATGSRDTDWPIDNDLTGIYSDESRSHYQRAARLASWASEQLARIETRSGPVQPQPPPIEARPNGNTPPSPAPSGGRNGPSILSGSGPLVVLVLLAMMGKKRRRGGRRASE